MDIGPVFAGELLYLTIEVRGQTPGGAPFVLRSIRYVEDPV